MSKVTPVLTSFNGGELSPRLMGRVDQAIYSISTAEMLNFVPTVEGPAMKRSGFVHVRAAAWGATWLSPFIFSDTQAYVLEWSEARLRFYTNGGRIETDPSTPIEVAIPFTAAEAPLVSTQQSYDRLYCAHSKHKPGSLLRTDATTFTYAELALANGPFQTRNADQAITVTASGTTGAITITASAPIFLPGHVGGPFMVEAMGFGSIKAWEPQARVESGALNVNDLRRSDGKVYRCADLGTSKRTGSIQPTHTRGLEWDGSGLSILGYDEQTAGVQWEYLYDAIGVGTITAVDPGGASASVTVTRRLADSLTGSDPSYRWRLPAFSTGSDYPAHVLLAFERLIFFTDFWMHASVAGDYGGGTVDMAPFSDSGLIAPDQAFSLRLAISNPILWARFDRDAILIGTADGIYAIRKINAAQIFSSDNVECVKQIHKGASRCLPVQTGISTIFVQAGGRKLREAGYSLDSDRYASPNINVWQRHILKGGCVQLAFQGEPDELLWAVRGDGAMALHPHVPEQEIKGFSRVAHGAGPIVSACAIPGGDGADQLWVLVNGSLGRTVEVQAPGWEEGETALADAFYVDSGATYSGAPTTTISGLEHLSGRTVAVLADGAVVAGKAVSGSGVLKLDAAASIVTVGLPFTARLTSLRPEARDSAGNSIQGKRKRIVKLLLRLLESAGVKVDLGGGRVEELLDRPRSADVGRAPPLFTGDTARPVGGSWQTDAPFTVISEDPLPCMVVAAMPQLELSDA